MKMTFTLQAGIPILHPHGKLTGTAVSEFRERLGLWIDDTNAPSLLIDFADVPKIDSTALGVLLTADALARQHDMQIGLINVSKRINNLIVLTRLAKVFQCFQDAEAAVATFAPPRFSGAVLKQLPTTPP
jgi:anti-sigma B factor antagonist